MKQPKIVIVTLLLLSITQYGYNLYDVYEQQNYIVAIGQEQNKLNYQEDTLLPYSEKSCNQYKNFFGVFDGHKGPGKFAGICVAHFVQQMLYYNIVNSKNYPSNINNALTEAFVQTHQQYKDRVPENWDHQDAWSYKPGSDNFYYTRNCGTTATVGLIKNNALWVANVGDSRAVISKNKIAERLSYDHTASDPNEKDRIEQSGGTVVEYKPIPVRHLIQYTNEKNFIVQYLEHPISRVLGLSVSRAIGELSKPKFDISTGESIEKDNFVIPKPYISKTTLENSHDFLIIASDGLWDVMSDQGAVEFVHAKLKECQDLPSTQPDDEPENSHNSQSVEEKNELEAIDYRYCVQALIEKAIELGSGDNISVVIVFLKQN